MNPYSIYFNKKKRGVTPFPQGNSVSTSREPGKHKEDVLKEKELYFELHIKVRMEGEGGTPFPLPESLVNIKKMY
jgi:hypothetical protein